MKAGQFFFKYRSFTPLPFIIPLFLFSRPTMYTLVIGFIIALFGEIIRLWGVSYAGSETRTRKVGASNFVTQGPFSYVRNPLYIGNIIIYFGVGIMGFSLFPFLQIAGLAYFFIQYYYIIIDAEEPFLKSAYKEKYNDYCQNVNRFMPKFSQYKETKQSKLKFDIKAGYKSEKRTTQGMITIILMIILIYILINQ